MTEWSEGTIRARTKERTDEILEHAKDEALTDGTVLVWIFASFLGLKLSGTVDWPWPNVCGPLIMLFGVFAYQFGRAVILTRREVRRMQEQITEGEKNGTDD